MPAAAAPVRIRIDAERTVSALLQAPPDARAGIVLAHGAGAGMTHPFMASIADGLAEGGLAVLRYQFPYMEEGRPRPDPPRLAEATVRAAVGAAADRLPGLQLFAGGKSFGGRMTSQAAATSPLPGVEGLIFLGFPLHPPGKPSADRAAHLAEVTVPMLFLQGTRDSLADLDLLRPVIAKLGRRATLRVIDDGDHSFRVRKQSGRGNAEVIGELVAAIGEWSAGQLAGAPA